MSNSIKVRVIKETSSSVTIRLVSLNRNMPVRKEDFEKRVASGLYVVEQDQEETVESEVTE